MHPLSLTLVTPNSQALSHPHLTSTLSPSSPPLPAHPPPHILPLPTRPHLSPPFPRPSPSGSSICRGRSELHRQLTGLVQTHDQLTNNRQDTGTITIATTDTITITITVTGTGTDTVTVAVAGATITICYYRYHDCWHHRYFFFFFFFCPSP